MELLGRLGAAVVLGVALVGGASLRRPDLTAAVVGLGGAGVVAVAVGIVLGRASAATLGWLALAGVVVVGERDHDWSLPWVLLAGVLLAALVVPLAPGGRGHATTAWDAPSRGAHRRLVAAALGAGALGTLVVGAAAGTTTSGAALFALGCAAAVAAVVLAGTLLQEVLRPARAPGAARARAQATSRSGTGTGAAGPT